MSDELYSPEEEVSPECEANEEFEEISSDEVDRVVAALDELITTVDSENIKAYLEEASTNIFYLVYDEEDLEDESGPDAEAA